MGESEDDGVGFGGNGGEVAREVKDKNYYMLLQEFRPTKSDGNLVSKKVTIVGTGVELNTVVDIANQLGYPYVLEMTREEYDDFVYDEDE